MTKFDQNYRANKIKLSLTGTKVEFGQKYLRLKLYLITFVHKIVFLENTWAFFSKPPSHTSNSLS